MSQESKTVAAIDIGTTKIVAIVGKRNEFGKLDVLGMSKTASTGVKRGVILNIEETINAIKFVVEDIKKKTNISITEAYVGIAGQHIKSIQNRGYINRNSFDDEITADEVQRLVDDMYNIPVDAGEQVLDVMPQSFVVDNETGVKNPVGMSGRRLEANFHIIIGQIASANNLKKCVERVGVKVNDLILEPVASSLAALSEDEKEVGVALVDIGGGTSDIAVFYDNTIQHTAVIPYGGNVITNDIKQCFAILEKHAESVKVQFGSSLAEITADDKVVTIPGINGREPKEISFKKLAHVIQSRMEEIIDAICFELESSGCMDKLGAGIVITGGGSLLKNLPQLISYKTGFDVRIGLPNEHLAGKTMEEINHPMYSTAIGLILKGFEKLEKANKLYEEVVPQVEETIEEEQQIPTFEDEEAKVPEHHKPIIKKTFLESLKGSLSSLFDDKNI